MTRKRISPEGYSVTDHEFRYLQALCDGPKHPTDIAAELAGNDSLLVEHRAGTIVDRLEYLATYEGIEHLVDRNGGRYALTEDGRVSSVDQPDGGMVPARMPVAFGV